MTVMMMMMMKTMNRMLKMMCDDDSDECGVDALFYRSERNLKQHQKEPTALTQTNENACGKEPTKKHAATKQSGSGTKSNKERTYGSETTKAPATTTRKYNNCDKTNKKTPMASK